MKINYCQAYSTIERAASATENNHTFINVKSYLTEDNSLTMNSNDHTSSLRCSSLLLLLSIISCLGIIIAIIIIYKLSWHTWSVVRILPHNIY